MTKREVPSRLGEGKSKVAWSLAGAVKDGKENLGNKLADGWAK
jgi:hypothetical protein